MALYFPNINLTYKMNFLGTIIASHPSLYAYPPYVSVDILALHTHEVIQRETNFKCKGADVANYITPLRAVLASTSEAQLQQNMLALLTVSVPFRLWVDMLEKEGKPLLWLLAQLRVSIDRKTQEFINTYPGKLCMQDLDRLYFRRDS